MDHLFENHPYIYIYVYTNTTAIYTVYLVVMGCSWPFGDCLQKWGSRNLVRFWGLSKKENKKKILGGWHRKEVVDLAFLHMCRTVIWRRRTRVCGPGPLVTVIEVGTDAFGTRVEGSALSPQVTIDRVLRRLGF